MAKNADYRKHNDHLDASRTYHKKDGTHVRAILKREAEKQAKEEVSDETDQR